MEGLRYECKSKIDYEAQEVFNDTLRGLENYSGISRVMICGFCPTVYYNQARNKFVKNEDIGSYRRDSLVAEKELTVKEEAELYEDIARGGIEVKIIPLSAYSNSGMKPATVLKIAPYPGKSK